MIYVVLAVATANLVLALFMLFRFLSYAIRGIGMTGWTMFALVFWIAVSSTVAVWLFRIALPMALS